MEQRDTVFGAVEDANARVGRSQQPLEFPRLVAHAIREERRLGVTRLAAASRAKRQPCGGVEPRVLVPARRVGAAERAHGVVERPGPLEIAHVATAGDHDKLRLGNRVLELLGDGER